MCVRRLLNCAFNLLTVASLGLLVVALFTPAWTTFNQRANSTTTDHRPSTWIHRGLVFQSCAQNLNSTIGCVNFWQSLQLWEQATFGLLLLAALACLLALVWSCVACGLCCFTTTLMSLLPTFVALAFLLDLAGVCIYLHYNGKMHALQQQLWQIRSERDVLALQESLGYSLYCAVLSCVALLVDTVVAIALARSEKY